MKDRRLSPLLSAATLSAILALAGCGPASEPACGPSNCAGCCVGDTCVPGTSRDNCGVNGLVCSACGSSEVCSAQGCAASSTGDRGHIEGVLDTSVDVTTVNVTLRYDYRDAANCRDNEVWHPCSVSRQMARLQFDYLRADYPNCNIVQTAYDGYTIDCSGNCVPWFQECFDQDTNGYVQLKSPMCWSPAYTGIVYCGWYPP
jgi:hypothetical protein